MSQKRSGTKRTRRTYAHIIANESRNPANMSEIADLPVRGTKTRPDSTVRRRRTDASIVANDSGIPEKGIRTCQNKRKTLYTPDKGTKTRTEKLQNLRNDSDTSGTRVRVGMKVGTQAKWKTWGTLRMRHGWTER